MYARELCAMLKEIYTMLKKSADAEDAPRIAIRLGRLNRIIQSETIMKCKCAHCGAEIKWFGYDNSYPDECECRK